MGTDNCDNKSTFYENSLLLIVEQELFELLRMNKQGVKNVALQVKAFAVPRLT